MRGLLPDFDVSGMNDPSLMQFVFQDALGLLLALGVVIGGPVLCGKARRWARLFLAFAVLWASTFLMFAVLVFATGRGSPLETTLRFFALADFGEPVFGTVLAVATALIVLGLLSHTVGLIYVGETAGRRDRFAWGLALFVVPVAVLDWYQAGAPFRIGFWGPGLLLYGPTLIAVLALLGALWRPRLASAPLQLGGLGGIAMLCLAASAYACTAYLSRIEPAPQAEAHFDEHQSRHWDLRFEQGAFTPEQRTAWGRDADIRLEALALKLGHSLEASPRLAYIHVTTGSKRAVAPERRTDSPYLIDPASGALYHLLAIDRSLGDPRGEALLLLREAWGEPGSETVAEAIARSLAGQYFGHDLAAYARRITCEEQPYTVAEILALHEEYLSPLVRDALAGAWVGSLDTAHLKAVYTAPLSAGNDDTFAQTLNST